MKRPARKKAVKKAAVKKTKAKKKTKKKVKSTRATAAERGCCILRGNGPNEQFDGLTREQCRRLANEKGREFSWWPGVCV
jgi:hypothetical protein